LKKQLFYWLALPVVFFILNCSHFPLGSPERDQGSTKASAPPGSASVEAAQDGVSSAVLGSSEKSEDTAGEAVDSSSADTSSKDNLDSDDCQDGDEDCQSDDKEPPAEKDAQSSLDEALQFCDLSQDLWQKGELDNALEALDKAYALICEVDTQEDPKLIQEKEDLRFLISKRILEIYASRNIVVPGDHDEIPMEKNKHVDTELALFTTGPEKDAFLAAYKRSGMYRPYIVEALKKAGLPEELSWLPLIESGFKVNAFSRARALGLWQFIPSTGYKFGLVRNSYIDERLDFVKSTQAAINYLKELHNIFGDWATVLAAYNCGEGRVLQVIRTQHVNYLDDFWDLYQRLPMETARYVPRFFATLQIVKHPKKYGLNKVEVNSPLDFEEVEVNRQVHLKEISNALGLDLDELEDYNPELRYHILPPEPYKLRLPKGKTDLLLGCLDSLPTCTLPERSYIYHRVRSGESLAVIARRYRISIGSIMRANHLRRSNFIRVGRRLKIPVSGTVTAMSRRVQVPSAGNHRVVKGDSLWNLADRYNTTVEQIKDLNNLSSGNLYIGQRLKIPGTKPDPLPDADQLSTYYVKRGDSPYTIAHDHKMPLGRFLSINRLSPRSRIYPGQKLLIE
jgi:peptidoglycan lytic transglycosylase D